MISTNSSAEGSFDWEFWIWISNNWILSLSSFKRRRIEPRVNGRHAKWNTSCYERKVVNNFYFDLVYILSVRISGCSFVVQNLTNIQSVCCIEKESPRNIRVITIFYIPIYSLLYVHKIYHFLQFTFKVPFIVFRLQFCKVTLR